MNTECMKLELPLSQSVLDDIPLPFHVYRADGLLIATNRWADQFWGIPPEELVNKFNAFENTDMVDDNFADYFYRALGGEVVMAPPCLVDTSVLDIEHKQNIRRWVSAMYFPFHNDTGEINHVVMVNSDFSDHFEHTTTPTNGQSDDAKKDQTSLAPSQVIQVWDGMLAVPLVGKIDSSQAMIVTKNLLEAIVRYQAKVVMLDISGLATLDIAVVHYLTSVKRACELLGSEVALVGITTGTAHTLKGFGIDASKVVIKPSMRAGIAWAFDRLGYRIVRNTAQAPPPAN